MEKVTVNDAQGVLSDEGTLLNGRQVHKSFEKAKDGWSRNLEDFYSNGHFWPQDKVSMSLDQ